MDNTADTSIRFPESGQVRGHFAVTSDMSKFPYTASVTILIVDDERTSGAMHGYYVRRLEDCTPVCFTNPREALEWAATHRPDAVVLDYLMPDIDGVEFTRRFRLLTKNARVPVLMVTGCNDGDLRYRARAAGVDDFLTKPVNYVHLSRRLLDILSARSETDPSPPGGIHGPEEFEWRF